MKGADLFGHTVQDKDTKFTGVVTGYCQFVNGDSQVFVSPSVEKSLLHEARWFPECRIEEVPGIDPISVSDFGLMVTDILAPFPG